METRDNTAYCGIFCPDCIHLHNRYSQLAKALQDHLTETGFDKYASIKSPFGSGLEHWDQFAAVLDLLANTQCSSPCRPGNGCSGKPCAIMTCCLEKGYAGCWECADLEACDKFDFLAPRCGTMPKDNLRIIREQGLERWSPSRHPFYIWQQTKKTPSK